MPPKKKVHRLNLSNECSISIIGIASHESDFRVSWALNEVCEFGLKSSSPLEIYDKKTKAAHSFSVYHYDSNDELLSFHLLSNKAENAFLIPEQKNIDYLLRIEGSLDSIQLLKLTEQIKKSDIVMTAFIIDINSLKSKHRLIF